MRSIGAYSFSVIAPGRRAPRYRRGRRHADGDGKSVGERSRGHGCEGPPQRSRAQGALNTPFVGPNKAFHLLFSYEALPKYCFLQTRACSVHCFQPSISVGSHRHKLCCRSGNSVSLRTQAIPWRSKSDSSIDLIQNSEPLYKYVDQTRKMLVYGSNAESLPLNIVVKEWSMVGPL